MPNRYICSVLEEMRSCYKTYNFGAMIGLIEEAQSLANRMESVIEDKNDYERYRRECSSKQKEYLKLRDKIEELESYIEKLESKKSKIEE